MVKGEKKEVFDERKLFVGFAHVDVVAFNPTREELNKLLGRVGNEDDKEIEYIDEVEGFKRLKCSFWLKEEDSSRLFVHSINIIDKEQKNKIDTKWQFVNSTCGTSWDESEEGDNLPNWFTNFLLVQLILLLL